MICLAIREKRIVELCYHSYSRIVEPYIYGRGRKDNVGRALPANSLKKSLNTGPGGTPALSSPVEGAF